MSINITLCSLNVRGLRDLQKRRKVFKFLQTHDYDVITLQETHSVDTDTKEWELQWNGPCYFAHGDNRSCGVAILFNKRNTIAVQNCTIDKEGRYIIMELTIKESTITLCNLYAPNKDDPAYFTLLFETIDKLDCMDKIIVGDFNLVQNATMDRLRTKEVNTKALEVVETYMKNTAICDIWRVRNDSCREYTWQRKKEKGKHEMIAARLDYFLISSTMSSRVIESGHKAGYCTDHSMVLLTIRSNLPSRGRGFWKLNARLLEQNTYRESIIALIKASAEKYKLSNPAIKWEMMKCEIMGFSRVYSLESAKRKRQKLERINERITKLEHMRLQDSHLEAIADEHSNLIDQRNDYIQEQTQSHYLLSKTKWYQYGERNSKFFFSLAKSRYNNKTMFQVYNPQDDSITTDPQKILQVQSKFYEKLYTNDPKVHFNLKMVSKNRIDSVQREALEQPISMHEMTLALKNFPPNKTPGCDGLPAEFFCTFWEEIGGYYLDAINHGIERNELHISARRGILTLIPKRDRNTNYVKNWRPLTMLSMCYKLFSKVLDNRLKSILHDIIQPYQTGFMSGRYILENVLKLMQIMADSEAQKTGNLIMLIDFEKCFDVISFSAINGALKYFGIGPVFRQYVSLLFKNFELCTQNNGFISKWIRPQRGLHQGCCISPHLFNCCGQVFADILENNDKVSGITAEGIRNLLAQFADDTSLFLTGTEDNVKAVSHSLTYAHRNLGLKVNAEKTTIYRIGSLKNSSARYYTQAAFAWDDPPIFTLGIHVTTDIHDMCRLNMIPVLQNIENTLCNWMNRELTLTGRVRIVNTLVESKLVYRMSVLPFIDQQMISTLHEVILEFIWKGKRAKIPFEVLSMPLDQGGLRLCNVLAKHQTLLCQWIFVLHADSFLWKAMIRDLQPLVEEIIWKCNMAVKHVTLVVKSDTYWRHMYMAWCKYNFHTPNTYGEIAKQIIWHNSHILVDGKPLLIKAIYDAGLRTISDLMGNEAMLTVEELMAKYPSVATWLDYQRLLQAIPNKWKRELTTSGKDDVQEEYKYDMLRKIRKPARTMYRALTSKPNLYLLSYNKWIETGDIVMTTEQYKKAFTSVGAVTISTKLRDFQYRLLHKKIPTNKELYRWNIKNSPNCEKCNEPDSITHTLYNCVYVQQLWQEFCFFIVNMFAGEVFVVNFTEVLLNRIHKKATHIVNLYGLILKQLIYRRKCLKLDIKFQDFIKEIRLIHTIELNIARQSGKVHKHYIKWKTQNDEDDENNIFETYIQNYLENL